jgi:outer membrane protein TolC
MSRRVKAVLKGYGVLSLVSLAALAGALTWFAGCSVGPDYVRPPAETPLTYKEDANWKVAQPRDELPRGKWWEIYNDRQLSALEEQVDI